jgi:hypothetical protein
MARTPYNLQPEASFSGNLNKIITNSEEVVFSGGSASLDISASNNLLRISDSGVLTLTTSDDVADKILEMIVEHGAVPITLTIDGEDMGLTGTTGQRDYLTSISDGTDRDWHYGGVPDDIT